MELTRRKFLIFSAATMGAALIVPASAAATLFPKDVPVGEVDTQVFKRLDFMHRQAWQITSTASSGTKKWAYSDLYDQEPTEQQIELHARLARQVIEKMAHA